MNKIKDWHSKNETRLYRVTDYLDFFKDCQVGEENFIFFSQWLKGVSLKQFLKLASHFVLSRSITDGWNLSLFCPFSPKKRENEQYSHFAPFSPFSPLFTFFYHLLHWLCQTFLLLVLFVVQLLKLWTFFLAFQSLSLISSFSWFLDIFVVD